VSAHLRASAPTEGGDHGKAGYACPAAGGGWVIGSLEQCDWLCSNVAAKVGAVVVSIGYRTAPAHRWPAAAEDCYAAAVDTVARAAELRADPLRLSVMGDSAGGNLAAVVALMARDRSGPAIRHQVLIYLQPPI
jgi:acetyl esterase/lipase